jgi:lysozyme
MSRFSSDLLARALAAVQGYAPQVVTVTTNEQPSPDAIALAAALCRQFEGLYLRPYLCPAAVWTIGYGATRYENGRPVLPSDPPITRARAEALLQHDLRTVRLPAVLKLCSRLDTPGRTAGVLDFAFNCGNAALAGSTLRKRINAGDWAAVPAELRKWVRGGGRVLPGLVRRRDAEIRVIGG